MNSQPDKIKIPELDIEVEDVDDFNNEASEVLTGFCLELETQGHLRPITEDDYCEDEDATHLWSHKASDLIEGEIGRLRMIGGKYFNDLDIDISTYMYKEI